MSCVAKPVAPGLKAYASVQLSPAETVNGADPQLATDAGTTPLIMVAGFGRVPGETRVTEPIAFEAIEPMFNLGGPRVRVDKDGWTVRTGDGSASAHFEFTVALFSE